MGKFLYRQVIFRAACRKLIVLSCLGICLADNVPASFVFGDSLVDPGNNNYIKTLTKANFQPYGIDFGGPTGRYTNGRTIPDIIAQQIGLKDFTPAYLAPTTKGSVILKGVNYGSGGGGILNDTGAIFVGRINFDAQLDNFANTREDIIKSIGAPAAMKLFEKAIFSITMGSNDFLNNYLLPVVSKVEQKLVSPGAFVGSMTSKFRKQLTRLYEMGARKIIVINVASIGCIPYQRDVNPSSGDDCVAYSNQLARLFDNQLSVLVKELNANLDGSKFLYGDVYRIVENILQNYASYGFDRADYPCCQAEGPSTRHGGIIPCSPPFNVCPDRSKYFFWDAYHPSDAANVLIAKRLMDGDINDIWPMNIRQLVVS